jgi:Putative restriction endonuclease
MTVDRFLVWAKERPERTHYELIAGAVVARAPERMAHARLKAEVWRSLHDGLEMACLAGGALPNGMTVKIDEHTAYEPDAVVHSGAALADDALLVPEPVMDGRP